MKSKDGGLGCGEAMIHGAIQELSTDSVKLVDNGKSISTRKEARGGFGPGDVPFGGHVKSIDDCSLRETK